MEIRLLIEKDIDEMAKLYVKSWRATYNGIIPAKILDTITCLLYTSDAADE